MGPMSSVAMACGHGRSEHSVYGHSNVSFLKDVYEIHGSYALTVNDTYEPIMWRC